MVLFIHKSQFLLVKRPFLVPRNPTTSVVGTALLLCLKTRHIALTITMHTICTYIYIYIRNYSYLEYAEIQSCPLQGKKRYIEYILFLEDFRRSILEDPILKNSAPPKTLGSHHGSPWFFPLQSRT